MSLKGFLVLALVAILFNGVEPLRPSWISDQHNFSLFQSRSHLVATEQLSAQSDQRFLKKCQKLIFKMVAALLDFLPAHLAILSTKQANAHHQVSSQLDYKGDVQNMNFQHCSHINVLGPYKCMGKQI